jgi:hypothetical protein
MARSLGSEARPQAASHLNQRGSFLLVEVRAERASKPREHR